MTTAVLNNKSDLALRWGKLLLLVVVILLTSVSVAGALPWIPFGPNGGDARSFGVDPSDHKHLYAGTVNGWVYESHDGGSQWKRLARMKDRDDLVPDHILIDPSNPKRMLVGVWELGSKDGGLFLSNDGGKSFVENQDMKGESVRSMTAASSDFKVMVIGTLRSVFRSTDGGEHWKRISPADSTEIHEVESVAIDPKDPNVIYAGTWHLPWKTTDAGEHWTNIKNGIIDDSDVFSIIVDPKSPATVYASACSGIYRSDTAGEKFTKIQGIPSTARRTRVLKQDPQQLATVFAGTTEGLFKTTDGGKNWNRTTGPEVIVNDVSIDPSDSHRVLIATDRGGVLASNDGGASFSPSNGGYTVRQVVSYAADAHRPANVFLGVVNDKEWGGVFASDNGGLTWVQQNTGLGARDVFGLVQAFDGTFVAGTSHGIFRLKDSMWTEASGVVAAGAPASKRAVPKSTSKTRKQTAAKAKTPAAKSPAAARKGEPFEGAVYVLAGDSDSLFAISTQGVLRSQTNGESWTILSGMPAGDYKTVAVAKRLVLAATLNSLARSTDGGETWSDLPKPEGLSQILAIAADDDGDVWAGGREGLFLVRGGMQGWQNPPNLPLRDINSIWFDRGSKQVLVTANKTTKLVFAIHLPDLVTKSWDTGWNMRFARVVGDHLIGATLYDGIVVQPRMVDSSFSDTK